MAIQTCLQTAFVIMFILVVAHGQRHQIDLVCVVRQLGRRQSMQVLGRDVCCRPNVERCACWHDACSLHHGVVIGPHGGPGQGHIRSTWDSRIHYCAK
eukprot:6206279-Pleurochrysis_carterae.AAC.8